ncbi:uncharacterized protein [Nicotiana tomentosiformis]|uniref:uncharacterized protein n=1 Tax=Nicotiana tomentosiformis TaxID=4098 RepID=UPI00388CC9FA
MVRTAASEEGQLRFARFKRYNPPTFSGLASESAQSFLEECHSILCTMDIVETSGVAFTTFQLKREAHKRWRAASLTWVQFSKMFLRKFVPQSLRDAWYTEFEQLRLGTMSVLGYAIRFKDLARHVPALVASVRGRVHRFIEGLMHDIRFSMARELESYVLFQHVVGIARRLEGMWDRERENIRDQKRKYRKARSPRRPERSTGAHGSQKTRTAQFPQPHQQRGCFECGDIIHMVRDCPRLRVGVSQRVIQVSIDR